MPGAPRRPRARRPPETRSSGTSLAVFARGPRGPGRSPGPRARAASSRAGASATRRETASGPESARPRRRSRPAQRHRGPRCARRPAPSPRGAATGAADRRTTRATPPRVSSHARYPGWFRRTPRPEHTTAMKVAELIARWPLVRQVREGDPLGLGKAVRSERSRTLAPRIDEADLVARSICPYCAVGCGQLVYVKGGASQNYVQSPLREYKVKYRRPYGNAWEDLSLDDAMEMIADRIVRTREEHWQVTNEKGDPANRTLAIGNLGGATLDNEENYLIKKLMTALGIVQVENQARI